MQSMDPIERVILVFKQVVKVGYATSPSEMSLLVSLYLQESALVDPVQVKMLECLSDPSLNSFAREVYKHMFGPGHIYVDTQVACLLIVGAASELGKRLEMKNPHRDF